MGYYAIGIGGTGAKCIESLAHLCAAGLMPDKEKLFALFVDPDTANGSLGRVQVTLRQYTSCRENLKVGNIDFLKTPLMLPEPMVWTPFADKANPCLADFFNYNVLKDRNPAAANLFDVLYSPQEKGANLDVGFRGHPSIGAAVMAKTVELGEGEPWGTFLEHIRNDAKGGTSAKIFLFGSIFGGTGAAGLPTISRLIRNALDKIGHGNCLLGGLLCLPYFSFFSGGDKQAELRATSDNFLMNSQASLRYYYQQARGRDPLQNSGEILGELRDFDKTYLLGYEHMSPLKHYSIGSSGQENEPHFIELYGALAAIDFFSLETHENYQREYVSMIATEKDDEVNWDDLPLGDAAIQLGTLARIAYLFNSVFYPMLEEIRTGGGLFRAPWYIDLFVRNGLSVKNEETQNALKQSQDYFESFLTWLANMHRSASEEQLNLFNVNVFSEDDKKWGYKNDEFWRLVLPEGQENRDAVAEIWERVCKPYRNVTDPTVEKTGRFMQALYRACREPLR